MEWTQVSIHSDEAALAITGITPADRPVEVRAQLRPAPQTGAAVQVSVGYFNDHHAQQALLQAIDDATTAWRLKQQRKAQR
jgi:hypothetical protein